MRISDFNVRIPRDRIQSEVNAALAEERADGSIITVEHADIDLRADGRVGVVIGFRGEVLQRAMKATMTGSGVIRYCDGEFFLDDFLVEDVSMGEVSLRENDGLLVQAATSLVHSAAGRFLGRMGITVDQGTNFAVDLVRKPLQDAAINMVRSALAKRPVYVLPDVGMHHAMAKAMLKDVGVEAGYLVLTLSAKVAARKLLIWLMFLLGIGALVSGAYFLHPTGLFDVAATQTPAAPPTPQEAEAHVLGVVIKGLIFSIFR